ncbi:MAG: hypothetical protein A3E85_05510 [Gammaproteobacteria bacterium RIFCSPHIGHO2_12_FULL_45_12]|nr:MAG: hypothetical protein A3E85_05510 [Gammaproteobacteria bacterium RIFCSPHIGHO2_12_FULL_45_12]
MSIRSIYIFCFLAVSGLLGTGMFIQYVDGIMPCPLCLLQRFSFGLLGILFFIGIFLSSRNAGRKIMAFLAAMVALTGAILAARQIWLQHFPPMTANECGASLQYMLKALPLQEVLRKIFFGANAECAEKSWQFLSMDMANWSLLFFLFFLSIAFYCFRKK